MGILVFTEVALDALRLYPLGSYMRSWNKCFTDNSKKQKAWIKEYQTAESEASFLFQRRLHLEEEIRALEKIPLEDLTDEQDKKLQSWEGELTQTQREYWAQRKTVGDLYSSKPRGAWIREFDLLHKRRKKHQWRKDRELCRLRGGCCDRGCRCCEREQKTKTPRPGKMMEKKKMHCTAACGCCARDREL